MTYRLITLKSICQWASLGLLLSLALPATAQHNTGQLHATLEQLGRIKAEISWFACYPGVHQRIEHLLYRAQQFEQDSEMNLPLLIKEVQTLHQEIEQMRELECPHAIGQP